jgi:hypothetical protein
MEKNEKIIYTVAAGFILYFAYQFIFRKANYTSQCEKELAGAKFNSEEAKKKAILECIMAKKTKNDAK